ncbi:MAG TPA: ATP-binding protein, partial [Acidimicrobiia bacterium]|nr:ATP-binding protein [Acidimicrobiia bacterium]
AIFPHSSQAQNRLERAREGHALSVEVDELMNEVGNRLITVASQSTLYFGEPGAAREGAGAVALAEASFASFQQQQLLTRFEADQSLVPEEEFEPRFAALEATVIGWLENADTNSPTVRIENLARSQVVEGGAVPDPETFLFGRHQVMASTAAEILTRVAGAADANADTARNEAVTIAAIVIGVLFVTVVIALIVGRSTVRRVKSVTAAARHVADEELPKLVDALSDPRGQLEGTIPVELERSGSDEVGELATSFSSLHGTLIEVANRQMEILRRGVSEIFVTLARRNGSLVDRQLALIDDLEAREEDPEILDGYYKLDHIATRMRRNAESLLVLAGSESPRMWSENLEMDDVVRAALGEVDEYQRIDVLALEPTRVQGRVVTDLAHLMSELLDNATQFSPPTERVRVTGLFDDDGYVLTIADSGVGISEERLEQINRLINDPPVLGLALEPTLGMYVVARLAARHGISVRLVPGVPGTTVRITLPRTLLETNARTAPEATDGVEPGLANGKPAEAPKTAAIPPYAKRPSAHDRPQHEPGRRPAAPVPSPDEAASAPKKVAPTPPPAERLPDPTTPTRPLPPPPGELPRRNPPAPTPPSPAPTGRHGTLPPGSQPPAGRPVDRSPRPAAPTVPPTLPTRKPGSSFQGDVESEGSSAVSTRGADGIRSALEVFRQGREMAPKPASEPPSDTDERSES